MSNTPDDPNGTRTQPGVTDPTRDHDPPTRPFSLDAEVHTIALRFDHAWQQGSPPDLLDYLPPDGPLREAVFRELIQIDEERRRAAGVPTRSAEYRSACPDLTTDRPASSPRGAPASPQYPIVPGFEIVGELGRGAMGVVYDARQIRLNRRVALKVVQNPSAGAMVFLRFLSEAEVVAAVHHPNVIQVHESGQHAGVPYLAMECLTGGTLAERLKAIGPLASRDAAELVGKIARGVGAAHDLGIVHRDLKPGNVLFDSSGEPKVADFGLAKRQAVDLTATQALMGTPAYMAPEQAGQRAKFVGPPADVWALGVMLYECLAGKRPFEGESTAELLTRIVNDEPTGVRSHRGEVPWDMETIIGKCLTKEPERRYATAGELADDLERFVRGEPITARAVGRFERALLWARRKPAVAAAYSFSSLAVVLAAVVLIIAGFWRTAEVAKQDAETARDQLKTEKKDTEQARDEAVRLRGVADAAFRGEQAAKAEVERERERVARVNYGRTLQLAYQAAKAKRFSEASDLLRNTPSQLRGWEYKYLRSLFPPYLVGHTDFVTPSPVVWSPDRRWVLKHSPGGIEILDASSGQAISRLDNPVPEPVWGMLGVAAAWSPDASGVVVSSDRVAWVWDTATGKVRTKLEGRAEQIRSVAWSPDGSRILTSSEDHTAGIWDAKSGRILRELKGHTKPLESASWSPSGSVVLTACTDGTARIWDSATGETLAEFKDPAGWPGITEFGPDGVRIAWSPDGNRVVTTSRDGSARVWSAKTGELVALLKDRYGFTITDVCWNPQGTRIATASSHETRVWDATTGKLLAVLRGHSSTVVTVAWSPNEPRIASVDVDGVIRIWDPEVETESLVLAGSVGAHFSADGSRIYTWAGSRPIVYDAGKDRVSPTVGLPVAPMPRPLNR